MFMKSVQESDRAKTVQSILVAGSPADQSTTFGILHWTLFLKIGPTTSVNLNMQPGMDLITGILIGSSMEYSSGLPSTAEFLLESTHNFTVDEFIQLLVSKGYTKYRFNEEGLGCRYWCAEVIRLLENQSWVGQGSTAELEAYVLKQNKINPTRYPLPVVQGTLYD